MVDALNHIYTRGIAPRVMKCKKNILMRRQIINALLAGSCLLLTNNLRAQSVPRDPAWVTGSLPNGFTYYIRKNNTPENRAVLYLVNKVGSILETEQQRGLAHFLEHMAFNGTEHFPKHELVDYLQKSGVRFGADLNAYTSFDETVYQLPVSTTDKTLYENAFRILHDWAHGATLDGDEIDKERGVVLEEKRLHLGVGQRIQDQTMPLYTNGSLYGARIPIGLEEVVKNAPYDTLRSFYHDWYRPDLQALVIVGDINVSATEKTIRKVFSDLPMPAHAKPRPVINIPLTGKTQFAVITDPEITTTQLELKIKFPALREKEVNDFREQAMRVLFSNMLNERFNTVIQQKDAPFLRAGVGFGNLLANLDAFSASVSIRPGETEKAITAWYTELERTRRFGFTDTELKRAATNFKTSLEELYKERDKVPSESYVRDGVDMFLHGTANPDIAFERSFYTGLLDTLKAADFIPFIQAYLDKPDRDYVIEANSREAGSLPTQQQLVSWFNEVSAAKLAPYEDKTVTHTALLDYMPTAGSITEETALKEMNATALTLSNGVKVILKPTTFKKDEIVFNASSPGGLSLVNDNDYYSATIASSLVAASGVGSFSAPELKNFMTGKVVAVSPYISELTEGFSGGCVSNDLETMLQLIYLYFNAPGKDPVIFSKMIEQFKLAYANAGNSPSAIYNDTLRAVLGNYNFRKMSMPLEKLDQLDADKALAVYKDRFADASDFTFVFVGSFDTEKIKPLLTKYLGSLPALNRHEQAKDLKLDLPAGRIARKVVKGKEPKAVVTLEYGGPFNYEKLSARQLQALSSVLNLALLDRLREDESGVYGVNARTDIRKMPTGQYSIFVTFTCDPQNVEPLILSVNSEIIKMKTTGPGEANLLKFKSGQKSGFEVAAKQNSFWLNYIVTSMQQEGHVEAINLDERLQSVTVESLRQTAQQYLNMDNYIRVVLVPETK